MNHFLEIQYDENDCLWVMIHSGSRNLGYKVCEYFNKLAEEENKRWYSESVIPFLPVDTKLGKDYIAWMNFCTDFALLNRRIMLEDTKDVLGKFFPNITFVPEINIHHNYASIENHMGKNLWVHRKGATLARKGVLGVVPGSQGTSSYIVEGKETDEIKLSLNSCSHGAGRKCSRTEFNKQANASQENTEAVLKSVEGVVHSKFQRAKRGRRDLGYIDYSEAPEAYKSIESVMANQQELVGIVHTLKPLICMKG